MVSSKEADQAVAALVYGLFSGTIFVVRLFGDRLRESVGDFRLLPICSLIAFFGMSIVLLSASPASALCGYIIMGLGLAPVVPTIFSLAGKCKGFASEAAVSSPSSLMAVCWSYLRRLDGSPLIHRSALPCAWCWFSAHWLL